MTRRLGRGLDFLLSGDPGTADAPIRDVRLDAIRPNPYQPRRVFDPADLEGLTESIRKQGVLQPVLLREAENGFELIAGERRWRASQAAGIERIPAVVRQAADDQMLELALVENLQRADLNPIEIASAYADFMERLGLRQEDVAQRVGRSRPAVANALRLLDLPQDLQELVSRGTLTAGHARALLGLVDPEAQRAMAARIERKGLSVRATEAAVRAAGAKSTASAPGKAPAGSAHASELEDRLRRRLGTKVSIQPGKGAGGKIVISYFSAAELDRLLEVLG